MGKKMAAPACLAVDPSALRVDADATPAPRAPRMRRRMAPRAVVRWLLIGLRFALEVHDLTTVVGSGCANLDRRGLHHPPVEAR
jgi:hypothetical protein